MRPLQTLMWASFAFGEFPFAGRTAASTSALMPFLTGVLATAFRNGDLMDQQAAVVLYALIAGLMCAAWLPAFPYLYRHPELIKPHLPTTIFASQVLRPAVGPALHRGSGAWLVCSPIGRGRDLHICCRLLCLDLSGHPFGPMRRSAFAVLRYHPPAWPSNWI
jgi:hypothetical protein